MERDPLTVGPDGPKGDAEDGDSEESTEAGAPTIASMRTVADRFGWVFAVSAGIAILVCGIEQERAVTVCGGMLPPMTSQLVLFYFGALLASLAGPAYFAQSAVDLEEFTTMYDELNEENKKALAVELASCGWKEILIYLMFATLAVLALHYAGVKWTVIILFTCCFLTYQSAATVILKYYHAATTMCHMHIDQLITQLYELDWHKALTNHRALDDRVEGLFAGNLGTMMVLPYVTQKVALAFGYAAVGVAVEAILLKLLAWLMAVGGAMRGILEFYRLAEVTIRCSKTSPRLSRGPIRERCIKAVVSEAVNEVKGDYPRALVVFQNYLNMNPTGPEICKVLVTAELVTQLLVQIGTFVPIAIGVLQGLEDQAHILSGGQV